MMDSGSCQGQGKAWVLLALLAVAACQSAEPQVSPDRGAGDTATGGCPAGLTLCAGKCTDTLVDIAHCGACQNACAAGQVCAVGKCALSCQSGFINCAGTCIDPLTSSAHCGASGDCQSAAAGAVCAAGHVCSAGKCGLSCQSGLVNCAGTCIDPLLNNAFCGASGDCTGANAGETCLPGQACSGGQCAAVCQSGLVKCAGQCVDPLTSNGYCGAKDDCAGANAGAVCQPGTACSGGQCSAVCGAGHVKCGGYCIDPLTTNAYCGAKDDCAGANAGTVCQSGTTCSGGQCVTACPPGQVRCGSVCVNPKTDSNFCGANYLCQGATVCTAPAVCLGGACRTVLTDTVDAIERGYWDEKGNHSAGLNVVDAGWNATAKEDRNGYFTFYLPMAAHPEKRPFVFKAQLEVAIVKVEGTVAQQTIRLWDVWTPPAVLEATQTGQTIIYQDLQSGKSFGELTVVPADEGSTKTVDLNGAGLLAIDQNLQASLLSGWFSIGLDNPSAVGATVTTSVRFAQDAGVQVRRLILSYYYRL